MPEIKKVEKPLALASESGDPAVHQLLAQRQTATMNGNDARVREVNAELAKLGYR